MRQIPGVVIGVVKDLEDPDGHGRIKIEFPWLRQTVRSAWAPIAVSLAGKERGIFFMPEIDDEALVAFEHGDFNHPFVVGFLWNGVDVPPDDGITTSVRRLRTVSGHVIDFDDRAGKERVLIQSRKDGHSIELKDFPTGHVEIKTRGEQQITLTDGATPAVVIKTKAGNRIEIKDVPPTILVSTQTGTEVSVTDAMINIKADKGVINVDGTLANIQAKSMINLVAPVVQCSGSLLAATVVASGTVAAASFVPAPGNTFGL